MVKRELRKDFRGMPLPDLTIQIFAEAAHRNEVFESDMEMSPKRDQASYHLMTNAVAGIPRSCCSRELVTRQSQGSDEAVAMPRRPAMVPIQNLPLRKRQILRLLLSGEAEKGIASCLGVSIHTVHVHVQHLYRRYGVNCRPELTALFVERSVLEELEQSCCEPVS
jgi:DNA-binding NarL/FixJ family response regulator